MRVVHFAEAYQEDIPKIIKPDKAANYIRAYLSRQPNSHQTIFGVERMLWDAGVPYYQGQHQSSMAMNTIAQCLEQGDFFLLDSRENAFDGIQFFGDISPFVSPLFRNRIKRLAPRPQTGSKQGLGEAAYGPPPEEPGLQSVTVLPIEWAVEGIADSIEQLSTMLETGPTLAGAATMAVALIPGKFADKALEPVVSKLGKLDVPSNKTLAAAKASAMKKYNPPCFQPGKALKQRFKDNPKKLESEFYKQLKGQQDGINKMSVGQYLENRQALTDLVKEHGHKKARKILTGAAQAKARDELLDKIKESAAESYRKSGKSSRAAEHLAEEKAKETLKELAALHDPDMIAGGDDTIKRLGNKNVNSSLGSQWAKDGRVGGMDNAAKEALAEFGPDAQMNVELTRCK